MRAILASNSVLYISFSDFSGPYGVTYGQVQKYDTLAKSWTNITPGMNNNAYPSPYTPQAFPQGGYCGLAVHPTDPETVVAISLDRDPGPAIDSMYLSKDGGKSWKDVSQLSTPGSYAVGSNYSVNGFWGHPYSACALKNGTAVPWLNFACKFS